MNTGPGYTDILHESEFICIIVFTTKRTNTFNDYTALLIAFICITNLRCRLCHMVNEDEYTEMRWPRMHIHTVRDDRDDDHTALTLKTVFED